MENIPEWKGTDFVIVLFKIKALELYVKRWTGVKRWKYFLYSKLCFTDVSVQDGLGLSTTMLEGIQASASDLGYI